MKCEVPNCDNQQKNLNSVEIWADIDEYNQKVFEKELCDSCFEEFKKAMRKFGGFEEVKNI